LLPAERVHDPAAGPAGAGRRPAHADPALPAPLRPGARPRDPGEHARGPGAVVSLPLAGQHPRASGSAEAGTPSGHRDRADPGVPARVAARAARAGRRPGPRDGGGFLLRGVYPPSVEGGQHRPLRGSPSTARPAAAPAGPPPHQGQPGPGRPRAGHLPANPARQEPRVRPVQLRQRRGPRRRPGLSLPDTRSAIRWRLLSSGKPALLNRLTLTPVGPPPPNTPARGDFPPPPRARVKNRRRRVSASLVQKISSASPPIPVLATALPHWPPWRAACLNPFRRKQTRGAGRLRPHVDCEGGAPAGRVVSSGR